MQKHGRYSHNGVHKVTLSVARSLSRCRFSLASNSRRGLAGFRLSLLDLFGCVRGVELGIKSLCGASSPGQRVAYVPVIEKCCRSLIVVDLSSFTPFKVRASTGNLIRSMYKTNAPYHQRRLHVVCRVVILLRITSKRTENISSSRKALAGQLLKHPMWHSISLKKIRRLLYCTTSRVCQTRTQHPSGHPCTVCIIKRDTHFHLPSSLPPSLLLSKLSETAL